MATNEKGETVARLRAEIDRGSTRDKVDVVDPAAAPLGTDDEAAGTPPSPERVARARYDEVRDDVPTDVNRSAPTRRRYPLPPLAIALLVGIGGLAVVAILGWFFLA
jgi:hypothetical protein